MQPQVREQIELLQIQEEILRRVNPHFYLEQVPVLIDLLGGGISRFVPNFPQQYIWDNYVQETYVKNLPLRVVILKARREGVSSYFDYLMWHKCRHLPGMTGLIMSHDKDASHELYRRVRLYEYSADQVEGEKEKIHSSRKEIEYALPHRSKIYFMEANTLTYLDAENFARGAAIQMIHLSEVARYDPKKVELIFQGLLPIVTYDPNTMIVKESTARYNSGAFYEDFWKAWYGESRELGIFLPWFYYIDYRMKVDGFKLSTEDRSLRAKVDDTYGVILEDIQLAWYRYAYEEICRGSLVRLHQEFPSFPEEAFTSTGTSFFDPTTVKKFEPDDNYEVVSL